MNRIIRNISGIRLVMTVFALIVSLSMFLPQSAKAG